MTDRKRNADFIVVGAGAMGTATAYQLGKLQAGRVILLDAFKPGHENGSSHGKTRVTRLLAIEGAIYAMLARRTLEILGELKEEGYTKEDEPLFCDNGFLIISDPDSDNTRFGHQIKEDSRAWRQGDEGIQELDEHDIRSRFPQFIVREGTSGTFDPTGGVLAPERCIMAQRCAAKALGVDIQDDVRMSGWSRNGTTTRIETTEGTYEAERVVFALGACLPETLKGFFEERLEVAAQIQHWFQPTEPDLWRGSKVPAFAWFQNEKKMFYGIPPTFDSKGRVKAATEQWTVKCVPADVAAMVTTAEKETFFKEYIHDHLASINSPAVEATRCLYTGRTMLGAKDRNLDFLIDRHPENENAVFISACSGHGFKHSAAIGERVAKFISGNDENSLPLAFSIKGGAPCRDVSQSQSTSTRVSSSSSGKGRGLISVSSATK